MVIGEAFGKELSVTIRQVGSEGSITAGAGIAVTVAVSHATETSIQIAVPGTFTEGVYEAVVSTSEGSTSFLVNAPTVYWSRVEVGPDRKGEVRVMGRNIARTDKATLWLTGVNGRRRSVVVDEPGMWDGRFELTEPIEDGLYKAVIWNGDGPEATALEIEPIRVTASAPASRRVINLQALNDANADSTKRINEALAALERAGGGTVKLTRGVFSISGTLKIPPLVSLRGEGEDLTSLLLDPKAKVPDVLISGQSDFTIGDLSISTSIHNHIIEGGFVGKDPIAGARNISIERIRIRASSYLGHLSPGDIKDRLADALRWSTGGPDAIRLSGDNISVTNSDILSSGRSIYLNSATNSRIAGNQLYNGRYGWYSISVSSNLVFENNSIIGADLQSTGGGVNTLFSLGKPMSRNILFKRNSFERLMGWDREAMTSDGPGGCYAGPVGPSGNGGVRIDALLHSRSIVAPCFGGSVIFLAGAGRGAVRRILATDDFGVLVSPRAPEMDASSQAVMGPAQENYLIIGNTFKDTGALQFFGTSVNHVVAENTFERSDGIFLRGLKYKELQPILYVQILNNTILSAPPGRKGLIQVRSQPPKDTAVPLVIGVVVRGNKLASNSSIQIIGTSSSLGSVEDILVEGNLVANSDVGIFVDQSVSAATLVSNRFDRVKTNVIDKSRSN
jgi:hypothetical protein